MTRAAGRFSSKTRRMSFSAPRQSRGAEAPRAYRLVTARRKPWSRPGSVACAWPVIQIPRAQAHQLAVHGGIGVRPAVRHDGIAMAPGTARRLGGAPRPAIGSRDARLPQRQVRARAGDAGADGELEPRGVVGVGVAGNQLVPQRRRSPGPAARPRAPRSPSAAAISCRRSVVGDASGAHRGAKLVQAQIRPRAECVGAGLHGLMEAQVLERVQRVVVDEDADRSLVGQHAVGARQGALHRGAPVRVVSRHSVTPARVRVTHVDADQRDADVAMLGVLHECRQHLLDVVIDVFPGAVDHHLLAVVHFVSVETMPGFDTNVPSRRNRMLPHAVGVALGDAPRASSSRRARSRRRR